MRERNAASLSLPCLAPHLPGDEIKSPNPAKAHPRELHLPRGGFVPSRWGQPVTAESRYERSPFHSQMDAHWSKSHEFVSLQDIETSLP